MNLPVRVSISDPILSEMFELSRDLCYKLDKKRTELILNQKTSNISIHLANIHLQVYICPAIIILSKRDNFNETRARRTIGAKDKRILLDSIDHFKNSSILLKL